MIAAVGNGNAAQGIAMPAQIFRGAVNHNVGSMLQWANQDGSGKRAVNDNRRADSVPGLGNGWQIAELQQRIREGFQQDYRRLLLFNRLAGCGGIGQVAQDNTRALRLENLPQEAGAGPVEVVGG